ncbi:MAG: beta-ketoacyl synthase N-terminal-like domain-containing protein [Dissulfurispiraceae bacterium]
MNKPVNDQYKTLMAKALLEIREMRARLKKSEEAKSEPVAIIGMGCRFPGADNTESFWRLLENGTDAVSEVPRARWDIDTFYDPDPDKPGKMYTRHGGFLSTVDTFDADFFGITPRELVRTDPQQRLLLEVAWEALEHAGIAPESLFGSPTGVFVGISSFDYATFQLGLHNAESIDAYMGTGIALSAANGRLSYVLGLNGPSMAVDTACSSSLVALHLACQSLRSRECGMALAGGVNLLLIPELTINFCRARMLAPDGRCKTFDAAADGYVRGEGCGVVVMKRLSDAEADGDTVLAIIRGSAVNQDGSSGGLTVPSGPSQEAVILRALENGRTAPDQVSYVEAHGTGTALGDPIEARSMGKVFGGRSSEHPLMVGSVKTNFGHLEAASGMAGLLKVVLSLMHRKIPAHLHFRNPSPHIAWNELPIEVPTELREWPSLDGARIAGVSSFGFSGTNVHVVVEEAPLHERPRNTGLSEQPLHLLTLSAKTEEALDELIARYVEYLAAHPDLFIGDICFTANAGRSHFRRRIALIASSTSELREKLAAARNSVKQEGVFRGIKKSDQDFLSMEGDGDLGPMLSLWGEKYVGGASLDWKELYKKYSCFKIPLPTYPFQKQRYWIETKQAERVESGHHALNPLLGRRLSLPGAKEKRFESRISAHVPYFLDHHRIFGAAVFPAAAYILKERREALSGYSAG